MRGDCHGDRDSCLRIPDTGQHDVSRTRDGKDFVCDSFDNLASIFVFANLAVSRLPQRGDSVQCAVGDELDPELAFDVVGNSSGYFRAREDVGHALDSIALRAQDQIATANMLDLTWLRN